MVGGYLAALAHVPSGVPQGSALRPTLFITFIKDLAKSLCNECYIFADSDNVAGVDLEEKMKVVNG